VPEIPDTPGPEPSELLRLAATGMDIDAIARRFSMSRAEAARALSADAADARSALPDLEGERLIERTHLDMLRRSLLPAALGGDIHAARLLVRIHQARAMLLGLLDEMPILDTDSAEEVNELDRIRARRASRRAASS